MTSMTNRPSPKPRSRAPYENWRPPIISVTVLAPVGATGLVIPCMPCGEMVLPTGTVKDGQSPESAAQEVLGGLSNGLPILRRAAVIQVQMRRRKVIAHVVVTAPLAVREAKSLVYRDSRTTVRVVPTGHAVAALPKEAQARLLLGLQALAIGVTVYVRDGEVKHIDGEQPAVPGCGTSRRDSGTAK